MQRNVPSVSSAGPKNTGSQQALRERNICAVITALESAGPHSQAELSRATGLSPGTISSIVKQLCEAKVVTTEYAVSSGRRAVRVSLLPDTRLAVGIDIGRSHVHLALFDMQRNVVGRIDRKFDYGLTPGGTFSLVNQMLHSVLEEGNLDRSRVVQCVVGLPASLDSETHAVIQGTVLPLWAGIDLKSLAEDSLGMPVYLENDANLGALASYVHGEGTPKNLVYIKLATGIGAGFVHDGNIYRSSSGLSGEIGHVQVYDNGALCYCGNRGCLETVASTRSLVESYTRITQQEAQTLEKLLIAARDKESSVLRLLSDAGEALGRVLAALGNLLAPDIVVIGGPLEEITEEILASAMISVKQRGLPPVEKITRFKVSTLHGDAELYGAGALAVSLIRETSI